MTHLRILDSAVVRRFLVLRIRLMNEVSAKIFHRILYSRHRRNIRLASVSKYEFGVKLYLIWNPTRHFTDIPNTKMASATYCLDSKFFGIISLSICYCHYLLTYSSLKVEHRAETTLFHRTLLFAAFFISFQVVPCFFSSFLPLTQQYVLMYASIM